MVEQAPPHVKWLLLHSESALSLQDTLLGIKPATTAVDAGFASFGVPSRFTKQGVNEHRLLEDLEESVRSTPGSPAIEAHKAQLSVSNFSAFTYPRRWLVNASLARAVSARHPEVFRAGVLPEGVSQKKFESWLGRSLEGSYDRVFGHLMGFDPKDVEEYARASDPSTLSGRVYPVLQYELTPLLGQGYDRLLTNLHAARSPGKTRVARQAVQEHLDQLFEYAMPRVLSRFGAKEGLTEQDFRRAWPTIRRQLSSKGRWVGGLYFRAVKLRGSAHIADYVGKRQASLIEDLVNNPVNGLKLRYPTSLWGV
ncbi:hypothetical protein AUJ14_05425 [Candidatus Micrarchaeota archaeon CG1_02_55_22]|nr:MAG: hypothetical protein AUJ14_05425 [Candidatus Micrarchaeota archaeon CG1_02_55_22]